MSLQWLPSIFHQYPAQKYDNHDYAHMASAIFGLMGTAALRDFIGRLVFNLAIGNNDMHLKNWSVIYRDGRTPELAPAYDYLCTSVYRIQGRHETALDLGGVKAFSRISEDNFERLAARAGIAKRIVLAAAREMRMRVRDVWPAVRDSTEIWSPIVTKIEEQFKTVPFFAGLSATPGVGETAEPQEEIT